MKKFFLFAAAALAALTVNAASFVGFDGHETKLGTQIHDEGLMQNLVNIDTVETDASKHKYNINIKEGSAEGEPTAECSFTMGGITFWYSNSNAGTTAYKTFDNYIQPNGNKRKVVIPTAIGEKVRIYAAEALAGVAVEGAQGKTSVDLVACYEKDAEDKNVFVDNYVELTAKTTAIVLWSDKRDESFTATKFKLVAILPVSTEAIDNVNAGVKAEKRFENGQLVIIKNGVRYNALGAQL